MVVVAPGGTTPAAAGVPDFGVDVAAFPGLDPTFTVQQDRFYVLGEALARRLMTPRGGLFYDSTYGKDLREYIGRAWSADAQFGMQQDAERECEQDERVARCDAAASFIPGVAGSGTARLELQITTVTGVVLSMVLMVSAVTVTLLVVR